MLLRTKIWGESEMAKALVIGCDPLTQNIGDPEEYCFYGNVYYRGKPFVKSELLKYNYSKKVHDYIREISGNTLADNQLYFLNMHPMFPDPLPPEGKKPLMTESVTSFGLSDLKTVLASCPNLRYIFAMDIQVNYWLQLLGVYWSGRNFTFKAAPKLDYVVRKKPFYEPEDENIFSEILGKGYAVLEYPYIICFPIYHINDYEDHKVDPEIRRAYGNIVDVIKDKTKSEVFVMNSGLAKERLKLMKEKNRL
ncbi:MAG: hypothetical protein ACEPOV_03040 [Hyphomicrobiales bacterium]